MFLPAFLQRLRRHYWRLAVIAALTLLAVLHALGALPNAALDGLERWLYDLRLAASMPGGRDGRIVIVQIDEQSLAALGQWPWHRDVMARLVDELHNRQQASAIGIDVVFAERQHTSGPQPADRQADRQLAAALVRSGAVIGYYFTSDRKGYRAGQLPAPVAPLPQPVPAGLLQWDGYGADLPALMRMGVHAGFFNAAQSRDGLVRAVPLIAAFTDEAGRGGYYESLALAVLRQALGPPDQEPAVRVRTAAGRVAGIDLVAADGHTRLSVPLDARGAALVPYHGPGGAQGGVFRYVSAVDVLDRRLSAGSLAGRIVLVGSTAPGLVDLRATPTDAAYPGVEVHASLIAGMLEGRIPVQPTWVPAAQALLLAALGMTMALALFIGRVRTRMALSAVLIVVLATVNGWLYRAEHLVLPLATPLALVLAVTLVNLMLGYWLETRAKQGLARQFAAYVPPELVRQMQADPDHHTMRARTENVTVLFCDLRGFTGLAEGMEPLAVQALLSEVFSRLAQVIQAQQGTIDKYMGDCVMAFWGAPLPAPDHAARAIRAALAMQDSLAQLTRERQAAGLPAITASIGVNTGAVAVGDMGSSARRAYTVIGDAVNLASRLERLTQVYGVNLIAGEATYMQARDWVWQKLDRVRVRGRHQTTSIYTVRAASGDLSPALNRELVLWRQALADWRGRRWAACAEKIEQLRAMAPDSGLYRFYAKRLASMTSAPPDDFDPRLV
ncbi:MAG: adenylate/guanylate cyclase domain-containing protein [Burkholderiaceae bacterium]|nr:adenylate/guanylate cyclase domain-containing protein [Burkholderiaceae bacterium]